MHLKSLVLGAAMVTVAAMPAAAEEETSDSRLNLVWENKPVLKSGDGKLVIKLKGRAYLDHAWINDSDNTLDFNGTEFRTARVGIDGSYGKEIAFRFTADFAGKEVNYKDIYIAWKGPVEVKAGHFKVAPSLDEATSSRFIPVMERAGYTDAFGFSRQFGMAVTKGTDKGLVTFGLFQGGFANSGDTTGFIAVARFTRAVPVGDATIHLGGAIRYRSLGDKESDYRYRQRPFQHQAPRFVNTGRIADEDTFIGVEGGFFKGPFTLTAEAGVLKPDLTDPLPGQADPTFWGGYVNVSYFLTGEPSTYKAKSGALDRPKVKKSVFKGGPGAWEAVFRYDYLDLVDSGIQGGIQKTYIIGVNWWLSPHIKAAVNYSHSDVSEAFLVAANGADGANKIEAFGIRTQIDW